MAFEYVVNGRSVALPINPNKIAVRFQDALGRAERQAVIDPKPEVGSFDNRVEVPNEKFTIIDIANAGAPNPSRVAAAADTLNADPAVERVSPVFDLGQRQAFTTDRILVGFKPDTKEQATEIIKDYDGRILESTGDEYVVQLAPSAEPFDVISNLTKRTEVEYAEPDFVTIGQHTPRPPSSPGGNGGQNDDHDSAVRNPALDAPDESEIPENQLSHSASRLDTANSALTSSASFSAPSLSSVLIAPANDGPDPLQQFQYAVILTQAVEAWEQVAASPDIKIAILDEGVDVNHPDLMGAMQGTFDAIDDNNNQQPNPWDGHGTACAGLAAAMPENGIGIRGTGGGCSLMGVRIALSPAPRADWQTSNSIIRNAIDWAWQNGADILSNSWGGGPPSSAIINAFERARTQGRNGKGCLLAVAAGNDAGPVSFPGNLPNVLTVSASNEFDEPKTRTSADGETWWGSNFGPEVDIAAPGVHNYTTDISGADGYNPGGDLDADYVADFNGTSSATPLVAGVAALVLSANPNLRESQVRRILKQSADKVGQVVYTNGRNDKMGFGRVNALRAVQSAQVLP